MVYDLTYEKATAPTSGGMPGTNALKRYLTSTYPGTRSMGVYSKRRIRGVSRSWSIHAEGRALDLGVIPLGAPVGLEVAEWLIEHSATLGIQYLIWDRRSWKAVGRSGDGWRRYVGVSSHRDHVHIEQTRAAAAGLTAHDIAAIGEPVEPSTDLVTCVGDPRGTPVRPGTESFWAIYADGLVVSHNGARDVTHDMQGKTNYPIDGAYPWKNGLMLVSTPDSGTFGVI